MFRPTAMYGSPLTLNRRVALPPWDTNAMRSPGYAARWNEASEYNGSLPVTLSNAKPSLLRFRLFTNAST